MHAQGLSQKYPYYRCENDDEATNTDERLENADKPPICLILMSYKGLTCNNYLEPNLFLIFLWNLPFLYSCSVFGSIALSARIYNCRFDRGRSRLT